MTQLDFILWLQSLRSPLLDTFFAIINSTAKDDFIILVAVILYWCISPAVGLRFLLLLLFSGYLHTALKDLFRIPRPPVEQLLFLAEKRDGSYAFPSGDAMNASVLWSYLAGYYRRWPLIVAAVILIPLVGLARIYRGAHWPTDVLGGIAIGIVLVWLGLVLYRLWDERGLTIPFPWELALSLSVPLLLFAIYPKGPATPPPSIATTAMVTGTALGVALGYSLERRYVRFPVRVALWKQVVKVVVGLATIFLLRMLLGQLFPAGAWFRFVRFALLGLWGTLGMPVIFRALFGSDRRCSP
ncbi:MAG: phosphatase PAP2 family protein [Anaerolineae bacterium]|nr:phosphatase PAP2 family protein [Anaerolineae bacterium]MDW8101686.1 phosphatase PAP2 family protein [Anaerolineae bacterium]